MSQLNFLQLSSRTKGVSVSAMLGPFRIAISFVFFFTLVFEPVRLALNKLGQYVGGVGGIGGLTNQYDTGALCLNHNIVG